MLRRHERARFSVYVFLSCEILRALRIDPFRSDCSRSGRFSTFSSPRRGASTRRWTHVASSNGFGSGEATARVDRFAPAPSVLRRQSVTAAPGPRAVRHDVSA